MTKTKTKKKRRFVSFLMIPDDYSEPFNLKLSINSIKIILILGIVLLVHIIIGGIFYFLYYKVHKENDFLLAENTKLQTENSHIYQIAEKSKEVEGMLQKLKLSLGIEPGTADESSSSNEVRQESINDIPSLGNAEIDPEYSNYQQSTSGPIKRINYEQSTFHAIFENYPTMLPVDGIISRGFDSSTFHEPLSRYHHFGIDIAASKGRVIKAAGGGKIVFSGWTTDLGYTLILYHGNNIFSYYAHNMSLLRQSGQVKKGEPIALLGSSGKTSTGPHLHFEIWRDGVPVDPKEYIFSLQR